jgi:hypothetical protein
MKQQISQNRKQRSAPSPKSRREFLKMISLLSAGTLVAYRGLALDDSGGIKVTKAKDHFSLNKFYPSLDGLTVPDIPYRAGESFDARYSLFSLGYDHFRREGRVRYSMDDQNNKNHIECIIERNARASGLKSFYHLKSEHQKDALLTPVNWSWSTKIADHFDAPPYGRTGLKGDAAIKRDQLRLSKKEGIVQKPLKENPLLKWSHWALFPELEKNAALNFSWIDEMERVFPGHHIRFRQNALVAIQNKNLALYAFQHTGPGIIPTVYWLNEDNNALLFVVSGIEIYILDEMNGKQLDYFIPEGPLKRN